MKTLIASLLLAFFAPACFAQAFSYNQGGTTAKNYYQEIPYESTYGKLFVYVTVGGGRHKFVFDTGAPVCVSKELVAVMGVHEVARHLVYDPYGGKDSMEAVILDKLQLGDLVFEHIPAVGRILDVYSCWGAEGSIGSNLFRGSIVMIDPVKQVIVLTDQLEKLKADTSNGIPMVIDHDLQSTPYFRIWFDKHSSAEMMFDSGDGSFIRFTGQYMEALKKGKVFKVIRKGYGSRNFGITGAEVSADKYLLQFSSFTMGATVFENTRAESVNGSSSAFGAKLLDYGAVTLDYIHGRFYFQANQPVNNLVEKFWPFSPTFSNNRIVVGVVWDNAPKELKPGQQILSLNNIPCENLTLCDVLTRKVSFTNGQETATVTVRDDLGAVKTLSVHKE